MTPINKFMAFIKIVTAIKVGFCLSVFQKKLNSNSQHVHRC